MANLSHHRHENELLHPVARRAVAKKLLRRAGDAFDVKRPTLSLATICIQRLAASTESNPSSSHLGLLLPSARLSHVPATMVMFGFKETLPDWIRSHCVAI